MAIFEFKEDGSIYHGVFFAELDNQGVLDVMNDTFHEPPTDYVAGLMACIWTNNNGKINLKIRIKFPSGNKQVYEIKLENDETIENAVNIIRRFPLKKDTWYPNSDGSLHSLLKIINDANMIEWMEVIKL